MFDLLDKDESNHYSPSSNKSKRHNVSDSGYPESYSNFNSKFQMNRVSHGSLNSKTSGQHPSYTQNNSKSISSNAQYNYYANAERG